MSEHEVRAANLAALAAAQPAFTVPPPSGRVQLLNGAWRLVDNGRSAAIHSRDAAREASLWASELLGGESAPEVIAAIGIGLGYLVDELERRGWRGRVLAIEPEADTIAPLLERRDWTRWIEEGRLRLLAVPEFAGSSACWPLFERIPADAVKVTVHPVFERLYPSEVEQARAALAKIRFDAEANAAARRQHGARYLLNTLRNLPTIAAEADVQALDRVAVGTPTFVVAAGPSLDGALSVLQDAQRVSLVIAVDTALRPLLSAGVTPHLVVAVDPGENNARHLVDLPTCPGAHLVTEASLDPLALAGFIGRTFLFNVSNHEPWPWLRSIGHDVGRLRAWGSVLTTAYDLALRAGSDPIVFVGADLAFSHDRPYCTGTSYEEDWVREAAWGTSHQAQWTTAIGSWPEIHAEDLRGRPVRTAPHLVAFRDWLVDDMRRHAGRRFINATGGGILRGSVVEVMDVDHVRRLVPSRPTNLACAITARHRPSSDRGAAVIERVHRLRQAHDADADAETGRLFARWEAFAPGVSRDAIMDALQGGAGGAAGVSGGASGASGGGGGTRDVHVAGPHHPEVGLEAHWLSSLADSVSLTPFVMAPQRLRALGNGVRQFRFRTTTARIICCALRPKDGAVCENGVPLTRAVDLNHVTPGSYSICRDEVHFRASDDSDPRTNGRRYTVLVPPPVAYMETLPIDEVLARGL
jgi:hypothetical protein